MSGDSPDAGRPPDPAPKRCLARWLVPLVIVATLWASDAYFFQVRVAGPEIPYTTFFTFVGEDKVDSVTQTGRNIRGTLRSETDIGGKQVRAFHSVIPDNDEELLPLLRAHKVTVSVQSEEQPLLVRLILGILPWALIVGVWVWLSRRAERSLGGAGILGGIVKGRTHRFSEETDVRVRFDDVAGLSSAKRDLREVVEFLRAPDRFQRLGARIPRGVLLVGPPGTGKTLLARAVAGEAGVPFFSITGSEFIELFVGVGASRVRELFESAKKSAPAIIFIDEIDAVGRSRGTGLGGGHDEREQTLNQLLSEMDGFTRNDQTIVLAATNRPDVLDTALLRPGRFDRRVLIDRPERPARRAILEVHTRGKPLDKDVDLEAIAAATPGFSGADLANLVNEAAIVATRRGADAIAAEDFSHAQDKVELGDPREGALGPDERRRVAVHEAGHALVAALSPGADGVKRITIIPRGLTLGATRQLAVADKHVATRTELAAKIRVLLGGYAAERAIFGEPSSGAENDLRQATALAYDMVAHYGMSDAVGPVYYEHQVEHPFLGQRLATEGAVSDAAASRIDAEVERTLAAAAADAQCLVETERPRLNGLVAALLDHETLEGAELAKLLAPEAPSAAASTPIAAE